MASESWRENVNICRNDGYQYSMAIIESQQYRKLA
jgi:hypothetical protein